MRLRVLLGPMRSNQTVVGHVIPMAEFMVELRDMLIGIPGRAHRRARVVPDD